MQWVLFKWRPSLNIGNIKSRLLFLPNTSQPQRYFINIQEESHTKDGVCQQCACSVEVPYYLSNSDLALHHTAFCHYGVYRACKMNNESQYYTHKNLNYKLCTCLFPRNTALLICSITNPSGITNPTLFRLRFSALHPLSPLWSPQQDLYFLMRCLLLEGGCTED